jgi:DNA-binding MarR family transcriptional regulator
VRVADDSWGTAVAVLRLSRQLVERIDDGVARRGFNDVRPAHGFAFARIAGGGATTGDVAEHLGVTKQAAAQLIDHLVDHGYVERVRDPRDARARLLLLTDRGRACTVAAEAAAREAVEEWRVELGGEGFTRMQAALERITEPGALRPNW